MRISRKRKPEEPKKVYFYNEGISVPRVLVLNYDGANLGVLTTAEAVRRARELEMDLVEINPKVDPPVAKIMDFGQFRYNVEKEDRLRKAHQHVTKIKGVRLSLRIGQHDMDIRKDQACKFLSEGHKVKAEIILRGRENQQAPLAVDLMKRFAQEVQALTPIRLDQPVERQRNIVSVIFGKA